MRQVSRFFQNMSKYMKSFLTPPKKIILPNFAKINEMIIEYINFKMGSLIESKEIYPYNLQQCLF